MPDPDGPVVVLVRPEWVTPGGSIRGVVDQVSYRGPHTDCGIEIPLGRWVARVQGSPQLTVGEPAGWTIERGWVPG